MPEKLPLVLDDQAQLEQIQMGDELDPHATGLASQSDFEALKYRHNLLVRLLIEHGIELPRQLLIDL